MESLEKRLDSRRRLIAAVPSEVFAAMSDAARIGKWGPEGFASTIREFDFRPGGRGLPTMHGPDGKCSPNESRFTCVVPDRVVESAHLDGHHFFLTIEVAR